MCCPLNILVSVLGQEITRKATSFISGHCFMWVYLSHFTYLATVWSDCSQTSECPLYFCHTWLLMELKICWHPLHPLKLPHHIPSPHYPPLTSFLIQRQTNCSLIGYITGTSLSEPHTSRTALQVVCVCLLVCLWPYTNFRCAFKYFPKIECPRAMCSLHNGLLTT